MTIQTIDEAHAKLEDLLRAGWISQDVCEYVKAGKFDKWMTHKALIQFHIAWLLGADYCRTIMLACTPVGFDTGYLGKVGVWWEDEDVGWVVGFVSLETDELESWASIVFLDGSPGDPGTRWEMSGYGWYYEAMQNNACHTWMEYG